MRKSQNLKGPNKALVPTAGAALSAMLSETLTALPSRCATPPRRSAQLRRSANPNLHMNLEIPDGALVEYFLPFLLPEEWSDTVVVASLPGSAHIREEAGSFWLTAHEGAQFAPLKVQEWARIRLMAIPEQGPLAFSLEVEDYWYDEITKEGNDAFLLTKQYGKFKITSNSNGGMMIWFLPSQKARLLDLLKQK